MANITPKGYSTNTYPRIDLKTTHRISATGTVPVYNSFSSTPLSPANNAEALETFLSNGDEVIVLNSNVGNNWVEILIPGYGETEKKNLFVYNNPDYQVLQALPDTLPEAPSASIFEPRDYNNPIMSYENRKASVPFYDASYRHYVVKIIEPLEGVVSVESALKEIVSKGARRICSAYGIVLPEYSFDYVANRYADFFRVIDYTVDIRGTTAVNLSSLVGYVAIKERHMMPLLPSLAPSTEEIAAQTPQYRNTNSDVKRVNEFIDPWMDPSASPLSSERFMEQYADYTGNKDQTSAERARRILNSRGSYVPSFVPKNISEYVTDQVTDLSSTTPDQARSDAAVAQQDLEREIGNAIADMFASFGLSDQNTRKAREEIRKFTAGVVAAGGKIEDVNDLIASVSTTLNDTPDIVDLSDPDNPKLLVPPEDIVSAMAEEMGLYSPAEESPLVLKLAGKEEQIIRTIENSKLSNKYFGNFFIENAGSASNASYTHKYPLQPHPAFSTSATNIYDYDNTYSFIERKKALKDLVDVDRTVIETIIGVLGGVSSGALEIAEAAYKSANEDMFGYELLSDVDIEISPHDEPTTYLNLKNKRDIYTETPSPTVKISEFEIESSVLDERTDNPEIYSKLLEEINEKLTAIDATYDTYNEKEFVRSGRIIDLYEIASEMLYQTSVVIPKVVYRAGEISYFDKDKNTPTFGNKATTLSGGLHNFYRRIREVVAVHEENGWSVRGLSEGKVKELENQINNLIDAAINGLVKKNILTSAGKPSEPLESITFTNIVIDFGLNETYEPIWTSLNCSTAQGTYTVFAYKGAEDERYDTDEIFSSVSLKKQAALHLFYNNELSDYPNIGNYFRGAHEGLATESPYSLKWREFTEEFFHFMNVEFVSPSELNYSSNAKLRTLHQNTKGRTEAQSRQQIRALSKLQGESDEVAERRIESLEREPASAGAREVLNDASQALTRTGQSIFDADIKSTKELATEWANQLPEGVSMMQPLIECLVPNIDLEKIVQDTEQYKLLKDLQDSLMASAETASNALNLFDTLEAAFSSDESDSSTGDRFRSIIEKAIDYLILEAFKRTLEYIQVMCLKFQTFLMEAITSSLLKDAVQQSLPQGTATPIPGTTASPAVIGNNVITSLASRGYSEKEISILSSPDAIRYIEDLSSLLSPSEFCQVMTKEEPPGHLLDIALGLYNRMYSDTVLSELRSEAKLLEFLRSMGSYIDPEICESLTNISRLPRRGYSHTVLNCEDNGTQIQRARDEIIANNLAISDDEIREILDNTSKKDADNFSNILTDLNDSLSGKEKITIDIDKIFNDMPEVKSVRKKTQDLKNLDLINAIEFDAFDYTEAIRQSGKEFFPDEQDNVELGPMGYIYRRFASAKVNSKLENIYPSLLRGEFPDELKEILLDIMEKDPNTPNFVRDSGSLAKQITEKTGVRFSKEDVEIIRYANPKVSEIDPFRNLTSVHETSHPNGGTYTEELDREGKERQAFDKYGLKPFLKNLKEEILGYTEIEREEIIRLLRDTEWKPKIGVYDNLGQTDLYYTHNAGDAMLIAGLFAPSSWDHTYPRHYSGDKITSSESVTPANLYVWLEASTRRQANEFFRQYKRVEGAGKIARVVFLGRPLTNSPQIVSSLMTSYSEISTVETLGLQPEGSYQINEDSTFEPSPEEIENYLLIKRNEILNSTTQESYSRDSFFLYNENGERKVGSKLHGASVDEEFSYSLDIDDPESERSDNLIEKEIRDLSVEIGDKIFTESSTSVERYRELFHYVTKQTALANLPLPNDGRYGSQIFEMLNAVRTNLTETDKSNLLKNKLPEVINEHLLSMFSIDKLFSDKEELKERFKSPIEALNSDTDIERRDYTSEEKVSMWISIKIFVLSFVADYYLKMLPLIMSSDFFNKNQNEVSKRIITKNIEVFLKEDRGPEFEVFKAKFLYYSNIFWLFLKQEPCSSIDLSDYNDVMSATRDIVEESIVDVYEYMRDNNLLNSSQKKQEATSKIIETSNTRETLASDIDNGTADPSDGLKRGYKDLADYAGKQIYSQTLKPSEDVQTNQQAFARFSEHLDNSGIIYIDYSIIEADHRRAGIQKRNLSDGISELPLEPEDLIGLMAEGRDRKVYSVKAKLNMVLPSLQTSNSVFPKQTSDLLDSRVINLGDKRVVTLDTSTNESIFHDYINPLKTEVLFKNLKISEAKAYLDSTLDRLEESMKEVKENIKAGSIYKRLNTLLQLVSNGDENSIVNSLIYYSFYDYFDNLGNRMTFKRTRQSSIDLFLKSDARGTSMNDFILQDPSGKMSDVNQGDDIGEKTFFEYYSEQMQIEAYYETPAGQAEQVREQILADNPDADPEAVADASSQAYADALRDQAEETDDPAEAAALENLADEVDQSDVPDGGQIQ